MSNNYNTRIPHNHQLNTYSFNSAVADTTTTGDSTRSNSNITPIALGTFSNSTPTATTTSANERRIVRASRRINSSNRPTTLNNMPFGPNFSTTQSFCFQPHPSFFPSSSASTSTVPSFIFNNNPTPQESNEDQIITATIANYMSMPTELRYMFFDQNLSINDLLALRLVNSTSYYEVTQFLRTQSEKILKEDQNYRQERPTKKENRREKVKETEELERPGFILGDIDEQKNLQLYALLNSLKTMHFVETLCEWLSEQKQLPITQPCTVFDAYYLLKNKKFEKEQIMNLMDRLAEKNDFFDNPLALNYLLDCFQDYGFDILLKLFSLKITDYKKINVVIVNVLTYLQKYETTTPNFSNSKYIEFKTEFLNFLISNKDHIDSKTLKTAINKCNFLNHILYNYSLDLTSTIDLFNNLIKMGADVDQEDFKKKDCSRPLHAALSHKKTQKPTLVFFHCTHYVSILITAGANLELALHDAILKSDLKTFNLLLSECKECYNKTFLLSLRKYIKSLRHYRMDLRNNFNQIKNRDTQSDSYDLENLYSVSSNSIVIDKYRDFLMSINDFLKK